MRDSELLTSSFEPLRWPVGEIFPEGGLLLGGPEKGGKSWWLMSTALDVAAGRSVLDRFPTMQGAVLYLAYEDSGRRLQERLRALMQAKGIKEATGNLHLYGKGEWPSAEDSGLDRISEWLNNFPDARMVIIDPVNEFDSIPTTYKAARKYMLRFVELGERHHVSFIISTHTGKNASSTRRGVNSGGRSWRDSILGRAASAADAVYGLFPDMGHEPPETAVLKTSGKDVKVGDIGLRFKDGLWVADTVTNGPVSAGQLSTERTAVLALLEANGPMTVQEIADAFGQTYDTKYHLIASMRADKQLFRVGGEHMTARQHAELQAPPDPQLHFRESRGRLTT